jgi:hypothetical protein
MWQLCRGGNSHGQEAKRQKDKDQTQASGEEKQTQTNEPNSVRAGDCDLSINIISASSRTERSWPMERRISDRCGTSAESQANKSLRQQLRRKAFHARRHGYRDSMRGGGSIKMASDC